MDTSPISPMDVTDSLEKWRESYRNGSRKYYDFSKAWDRFEESMWAEYASLDSRREELSLPRLPWQPQEEAERDAMNRFRKRLYKPWGGRLMQFCPLWICLSWKTSSSLENEREEYPWRAALTNWARFENRCENDPEFRKHLSPSQLNSYELLRDWWQARYCDKSLVEKTKAYMERLTHHCRPPLDIVPDSHAVLKGADLTTMENKSRYEYRCFKLFVREFHPDIWSPYAAKVNVNTMVSARRYAAQCAIAQRLSFPVVSKLRGPASADYSRAEYPKLSLSPITTSEGLPYYLWDAEECRTIEAGKLPDRPAYACISHTWGRWVERSKPPFKIHGVPWPVPRIQRERFDVRRLPEELKKLRYRYIWIDLFCIPQAPVQPWSLPYRKKTLSEWRARADDEISRQSQIFHGSSKCVAWLNDVSSWNPTILAIEWMGLRFLKQTGFSDGVVPQEAVRKSGFVDENGSSSEQGTVRDSRPRINIGWFTSLWTLQEAVLCPDMELFSADWSKLTDAWDSAISLRTIMVFIDQCRLLDGRDAKSWPDGPMELSQLENICSLSSVFITESPTVICSLTSTRTCSGPPQSRAPAIMSAIGVTDWWHTRDIPVTNRFGEQEIPSQAVLESYPLGFLQEAAQKIGATFFQSVTRGEDLHDETTREMILERAKLGTQVQDGKLRDAFTRRYDSRLGTMLPFRKPGSYQSWMAGDLLEFPHTDMVDHPSVSSWHICKDGSVRILKAGILLSSAQSAGEMDKINANVYCSEVLRKRLMSEFQGTEGNTDLDLAAALRVLAGNDRAYAVTLYTEGISHYGVILLGFDCGETSTQYFVKLGIYSTVEVVTPETSDVNWVVL